MGLLLKNRGECGTKYFLYGILAGSEFTRKKFAGCLSIEGGFLVFGFDEEHSSPAEVRLLGVQRREKLKYWIFYFLERDSNPQPAGFLAQLHACGFAPRPVTQSIVVLKYSNNYKYIHKLIIVFSYLRTLFNYYLF